MQIKTLIHITNYKEGAGFTGSLFVGHVCYPPKG